MIPHISIIVLNWNGKDLTAECLHSLEKITYPEFSIYVIDNGSTDGSADVLKSAFPKVKVIELPENLGYAEGNNRGFDLIFSKEQPSSFVLFLNNDTLVRPDFLDELVKGMNKFGHRHIYSPKILYADLPNRIWYAGGIVDLTRAKVVHSGIREPDDDHYSKDIKTGFVSGCSMLIPVQLFIELNGFDKTYKMYAEDVDLCLRAAEKGVSCYMIANSKIYHRVSASMGGNQSLKKNLRKLRSILKLIFRHTGLLTAILSTGFLVYQIPRQYFSSRKFTNY